MFSAAEIGDSYTGWIGLSASPADGDDAQLVAFAPGDQSCLGTEAVDTVNNVIVFFRQ